MVLHLIKIQVYRDPIKKQIKEWAHYVLVGFTLRHQEIPKLPSGIFHL